MKYAYTHNTVDWVSVKGAVALSLCRDFGQSIRLAAPFARMEQTPIFDP